MRNIRVIFVAIFFQNWIFAYAIERIFWESRSMSVQDVVLTEFVFIAAILALEIPAGIVADRYPRKTVLICAALAQVVEFVLVALATTFAQFAVAVAIAALAQSLTSGTFNAIVYDSLDHEGASATFPKVLGRIEAFDSLTVVAALTAGGFVAERTALVNLYWLGAAASAIAMLVLAGLSEPVRGRRNEPASHPIAVLKSSLALLKQRPSLRAIVVAGVCVAGSIVYLDEFMTLYLRDNHLPVWSFGVVLGAVYVFRSIGSLVGDRMVVLTGHRWFVPAAVFVFLVLQIVFGVVGIWPALAISGVLYLLWGAIDVVRAAVLHDAAEDAFRATAESVVSQIEQVVSLGFGLLFSVFARRGGIAAAVALTAACAAAAYLGYCLLDRRDRRTP